MGASFSGGGSGSLVEEDTAPAAARNSCQRLTSSDRLARKKHENQGKGDGRLARGHSDDEERKGLAFEVAAVAQKATRLMATP